MRDKVRTDGTPRPSFLHSSTVLPHRYTLLHQQLRRVKPLMLLYIAVFLARALWSLTYSLNANYLQQWLNKLERKTDLMPYYGAMCVFYFIFEVCALKDGLSLFFCSPLPHFSVPGHP